MCANPCALICVYVASLLSHIPQFSCHLLDVTAGTALLSTRLLWKGIEAKGDHIKRSTPAELSHGPVFRMRIGRCQETWEMVDANAGLYFNRLNTQLDNKLKNTKQEHKCEQEHELTNTTRVNKQQKV